MKARPKKTEMIRKQIDLAHRMGPVYEDVTRALAYGSFPVRNGGRKARTWAPEQPKPWWRRLFG